MSNAIFIYARFMPRSVKVFATETVAAPNVPMTILTEASPKYVNASKAVDSITRWANVFTRNHRRYPSLQDMASAPAPEGFEFIYLRGDGRTQSSRILVKQIEA